MHPNLESLYKFVPKDMLPEEYGGQAGPIAEINSKNYNEKIIYISYAVL